jgi:two-component system phosphate regulon sensor histidine kinase PhoR
MRQNFVSNVSHELRTPLTTMKALTETLQQCIGSDPQSAQHFLNLMDVEIDKLTQMVLELLDLSRIESGRVEMNKTSVNVLELLTPPVERMKLQADRAHVDLKVDRLETLPAIYVDAEQIERVLLNIIHNAIKYTSPGGSITLSAEAIEQEMVIKINDTGEGISEQDLPRIFERFYKTDQARSSGGTGLGLAIAKHIVEAHQGRIWVESKKGVGSTFFIALPLT